MAPSTLDQLPENAENSSPVSGKRIVVLHYHLFKNAGTSVDQALAAFFGDSWRSQEGPGHVWRTREIAEYLERNPEVSVLSSHTAALPPPTLADTLVLPLLFLRHPLDRIRSIYNFERQQDADTDGARMAKKLTIARYIEWRLTRPNDRAITNFQTLRLSQGTPEKRPDGAELSELARAERTLEVLPFVGLVEDFNGTIKRLNNFLRPYFPTIKIPCLRANTTQSIQSTLDQRLHELRSDIGDFLFDHLLEKNSYDVYIHGKLINSLHCDS